MKKIGLLDNKIQPYSWGSRSAISALMGRPLPSKRPEAELWMGTHPKAPSKVKTDAGWESLGALIDKYPKETLNASVAAKFNGRLPYLFKVLAAEKPLSIQAHPSRIQAAAGYRRENSLGISVDAFNRNYKDDNHKPECICALTPFQALCGFRKVPDMVTYLKIVCPETLRNRLSRLAAAPDEGGLKTFFKSIMTMEREKQKDVVLEAAGNAERRMKEDPVFAWIVKLNDAYPSDIGVIFPAILNFICLQPGEAMYLAAGDLHAYLNGVGIELMANSDNVLRGGLTQKHIDVPELLNVLSFGEKTIDILLPEQVREYERIYKTPAEEFALSVIALDKGGVYTSPFERSAEILLCTEGSHMISASDEEETFEMTKGISVFIPASASKYQIEGQGIIYKAGVPIE